jgi:hypothetical protein
VNDKRTTNKTDATGNGSEGAAIIMFEGVGADESGTRRFLKVRSGKKASLLSVSKLASGSNEEFNRLEAIGAPLIRRGARTSFLAQAHVEANRAPTFGVATKIGLHDNVFVLPYGAFPRRLSDVELYLDERHEDVHRKFQCAGTDEGFDKFFKLSAGNTRLIAGYALAVSGPVCAAFNLDPPGLQFVGGGGTGKSPAAAFISSIWGWDTTPGAMLGCGSSWNATPDAIELIAAGCNQTLIFLDEMSQASKNVVDAVMRTIQGQGKARYTELHRLIWCTPLLSTSNTSIVAILRGLASVYDIPAYVDRLIDIPLPKGCDIYFEDLHGFSDIGKYCERMRDLASQNHGCAGRGFAVAFVNDLAKDRSNPEDFVRDCRAYYIKRARHITAVGRDLMRVHGRLATLYAAGSLAIEYRIFPFSRKQLLDALLACERDHVAFVASEMGSTFYGSVATPDNPKVRLERYLEENRARFVDVRTLNDEVLKTHDYNACVGYRGTHDGEREIWLTNERFEVITGGKVEGNVLKEKLQKEGKLSADRRGEKLSYVVKRFIPGAGRSYVVALKDDKSP